MPAAKVIIAVSIAVTLLIAYSLHTLFEHANMNLPF